VATTRAHRAGMHRRAVHRMTGGRVNPRPVAPRRIVCRSPSRSLRPRRPTGHASRGRPIARRSRRPVSVRPRRDTHREDASRYPRDGAPRPRRDEASTRPPFAHRDERRDHRDRRDTPPREGSYTSSKPSRSPYGQAARTTDRDASRIALAARGATRGEHTSGALPTGCEC
jgi:hypothetical protein